MDYTALLKTEYQARKLRNASYSLRAFAKDLQLSAATLSQILNGRRLPSARSVERIAKHLNIKDSHLGAFLREPITAQNQRQDMDQQTFGKIADWYYYAILGYINGHDPPHKTLRIATALGLEEKVVAASLQQLIAMDIIIQRGSGYWQKRKLLHTESMEGDEGIRRFHDQMGRKAVEALDRVPVHLRHFVCLISPISAKKLSKIKAMMDEFGCLLSQEAKDDLGRVYGLNLQLFPLEKD